MGALPRAPPLAFAHKDSDSQLLLSTALALPAQLECSAVVCVRVCVCGVCDGCVMCGVCGVYVCMCVVCVMCGVCVYMYVCVWCM